ncbi:MULTISPECIES: hypothetical protein [Sphingomonas]|uniref:hypothetical protein n=1 Tax=Sphingomonas TaxID=13687 RepID=UPI000DEFA2F8|nr:MULTISPECIES: hypothetical protein [Sphingomonas]
MVPEDEFTVAMICSLIFFASTMWLMFRNWRLKRKLRKLRLAQFAPAAPLPPAPPQVLPAQPDPQIAELKERIKVLERITVDREGSLAREIELLRDRA